MGPDLLASWLLGLLAGLPWDHGFHRGGRGGNSWKHPVKRTLSLGLTLDLDRPSSTDLWGTMYPASSLMASPNLTLVLTDRNFHPLHQIDYHLLEDGLEFRLADLEPAIRYLFIKTLCLIKENWPWKPEHLYWQRRTSRQMLTDLKGLLF